MTIKSGDTVQIHYVGRLLDGEEFDNSTGREPLEFKAGSDELIPGVSNAVLGMSVGDKRTVEIPPKEGYGERRDDLVFQVPKTQLPDGADEGAVLGVETPEGEMRVQLTGFEGDSATLDGNHFLAGQTLVFDIEIVGFDAA